MPKFDVTRFQFLLCEGDAEQTLASMAYSALMRYATMIHSGVQQSFQMLFDKAVVDKIETGDGETVKPVTPWALHDSLLFYREHFLIKASDDGEE